MLRDGIRPPITAIQTRQEMGKDIQAATISAKEDRRKRQTPHITTGEKS
jgi:hypothetical protein